MESVLANRRIVNNRKILVYVIHQLTQLSRSSTLDKVGVRGLGDPANLVLCENCNLDAVDRISSAYARLVQVKIYSFMPPPVHHKPPAHPDYHRYTIRRRSPAPAAAWPCRGMLLLR